MSCFSCSKQFPPSLLDIISCSFCDKKFHYECSSLDRAAINSLKKFPNLTYFCDCCKIWIKNNQVTRLYQKIDVIADRAACVIDVKKLESDVAENTKLIHELLSRVPEYPVSASQSTYAKVTVSDPGATSILPLRDGVIGTGEPVDCIKPAVVQEKKYLYVTRVDPSVTQDSIVNYIRSKLEISSTADVDCKLLLPKDRVIDNTLTFVSFKIGLSDEQFLKLNNSTMWPQGVVIRPFVNHPRKPKNRTVGNFQLTH